MNGLLTSTNTTSTDQSANIPSSLASAAVGLISFIGAGVTVVPDTHISARREEADRPPPRTPEPEAGCNYSLARVFDPTNSDDVTKINSLLHDPQVQAHLQLQSTFDRSPAITAHPIDHIYLSKTEIDHGKVLPPPDPTRIDGLVYRTPAGVGVAVSPYHNAATKGNCPLQAPV